MQILIGCEYSGTVRNAFLARGFDAYSNDIIATESLPERHLQMDIMEAIKSRPWRGIIIHIPCTAMAVCGNRHYAGTQARRDAIEWSIAVWDCAVEHAEFVAMENPASVLFPHLRDRRGAVIQYVQPWQFGHMEQKKTGFALRGFKPLEETRNVYREMMRLPPSTRERIFRMGPSADRGKERARFYPGISDAMAEQWGLQMCENTLL